MSRTRYPNTPEYAVHVGWAHIPEYCVGDPTLPWIVHDDVLGRFEYTAHPELGPADQFMSATTPTHLILRWDAQASACVPVGTCPADRSDPNDLLPDWFFGLQPDGTYDSGTCYTHMTIRDDVLEWVPAMGPAPIWTSRPGDHATVADAIATWDAWMRETY